MRRVHWFVAIFAVLLAAACSGDGGGTSGDGASGRSDAFLRGEALFVASCSLCHGAVGEGTQTGPPLVHPIYRPNHHPDFSFHNAVNNGVPQHHWAFGDMAPRAGLPEKDIDNIICYVRQLQLDADIYEGETPC